jgi:hypothetical protein
MDQAKAPSAGSTQATGNSRGLFRRAFATRGAIRGSKGSGAPAGRRMRAALATLALAIAAFALTAAPALAAPTVTTPGVSKVSYTTAHVSSSVDPVDGVAAYNFEVSTNGTTWTPNAGGFFFNKETLNADLSGLEGGTQYFVRLVASSGFSIPDPPETVSAGPDPSLTTLTADPPTIPGAVTATNVLSVSATGSAKVIRPVKSDDLKCHFEYITDAQYKANELASDPLFQGATPADCAENPIKKEDAGTEKAVTAQLTGFSPETTYHLRLVAENAAPGVVTKDAASTFTTPTVAKPVVIATDDASRVQYKTATFTGIVQRPTGEDPGLNTECHFEIISDAQFTANEGNGAPGFTGASSAPCQQNPITSPGQTSVKAIGTAFFEPETTYRLRLVAENAGGSDVKDASNTFTTTALIEPVVTVGSPVAGYTTAEVSGTVNPEGCNDYENVSGSFEYSIEPANPASWTGSNVGYGLAGDICNATTPQAVGGTIEGLQPSTTYAVRLSATNYFSFNVFSSEPYPEFTTQPLAAPSASCDAVTGVTATGAHFSCVVNPHAPAGPLSALGKKAYETKWHFECTPECKDANGNVIGGIIQGEEGAQPVAGDVKRLDPNQEYEVRLVISGDGGGETVVDTFNTPLIKPTVKAAAGGSDGKGGYTIQGIVNPNRSNVSDCKFEWGPNSADYAFTAPCSPAPGDKSQPVTVEAHLSGLNPGVVYHYNLLATNAAGKAESGDQEFIPTLDPAENCANEQLRKENSSLALPECRAYEKVSPSGKEGFDAILVTYDGGDRVRYDSGAGNIAQSGLGSLTNNYVATRSAAGWETIPNLNGSSGSLYDAPSNFELGAGPEAYSSDLLSSMWYGPKNGSGRDIYLRRPDGTFTLLAKGEGLVSQELIGGASNDLSHLFITPAWFALPPWGPGVYEFLGTGNEQPPRRVDVDNSGSPITTCSFGGGASATKEFNSGNGRVVLVRVAGGCGGTNPPADELWARIDGTTSIDVSASQCNRTAADPGGVCNAPLGSGGCTTSSSNTGVGVEAGPGCRFLKFQGATPGGSRVFFTTRQQLLDADIDETNDLYACDIPAGIPAPVGRGNHCSAFRQVSAGDPSGAVVESAGTISENGATAMFTAKGVLADNEDALGEEAVAGDHNLYAWHTDGAHPDGQMTFVGRLDSDDLRGGQLQAPQATPDGRYLAFTTTSQLLDTDTDQARDVYRYDVETEELTRASTNVFGVAGNGAGFEARISPATTTVTNPTSNHHATTTISDDGQKIVFTTSEALSAADGNGESDAYLWTPGRVSLISTGSVGGGASSSVLSGGVLAAISGSGRDIYFQTRGALTPADGDDAVDIYDARVGGGFSFASAATCSGDGGGCQAHAPAPAPGSAPVTARPSADPGNVKPCPKGKVAKGSKCVKKKHKKHQKKSHKKTKRTASHGRGGNK